MFHCMLVFATDLDCSMTDVSVITCVGERCSIVSLQLQAGHGVYCPGCDVETHILCCMLIAVIDRNCNMTATGVPLRQVCAGPCILLHAIGNDCGMADASAFARVTGAAMTGPRCRQDMGLLFTLQP